LPATGEKLTSCPLVFQKNKKGGTMSKKTVLFSTIVALVTLILGLIPACTQGGTPSGEQVLNVNLAGEPAQIDPNRASWAAERSVIGQVFEGLLGFDKNLAVIPVVAKELPTVANKGISADGKTYTFNLKTNVTWSDGKKVTAKDFAYSIVRMLDPDLATEYASFYYPIAGAEAYNGAATKTATEKAALKAAVGVKATGDYTLQITLGDAYPVFLQLMSLWPVYPVREDIITANGDKWTEAATYIGNGPFKMSEWVHQDHITFVQNPNYWGTKPKLTKITYKMITDANAALAAYKNGELDMSGVPVGTEKATMADATLNKEIVRNADLTTFAFQFNVHTAPYDNLNLRKALSTGIDRAAFVDKVRGGVGKVALSWIPPGMPGYDATLGTEYSFDVAKAKALLATALTELKLADASKLALKFQFSDTASNKTIAQFLQGQLKDNLGITLTLEPMESKAFTQMVNGNKHTWAWFGWGADYPDPDNWLPQLFGTGAGNNHTTYSNPAFDALAKQAGKELDNTKRLQMWADAQKMVMADAPIVTMFYRERFVLVKPYLKGLTPTGMDGQIMGDQFWTKITIEK
jgi:oligopeptide transport system substrate-binding protein